MAQAHDDPTAVSFQRIAAFLQRLSLGPRDMRGEQARRVAKALGRNQKAVPDGVDSMVFETNYSTTGTVTASSTTAPQPIPAGAVYELIGIKGHVQNPTAIISALFSVNYQVKVTGTGQSVFTTAQSMGDLVNQYGSLGEGLRFMPGSYLILPGNQVEVDWSLNNTVGTPWATQAVQATLGVTLLFNWYAIESILHR